MYSRQYIRLSYSPSSLQTCKFTTYQHSLQTAVIEAAAQAEKENKKRVWDEEVDPSDVIRELTHRSGGGAGDSSKVAKKPVIASKKPKAAALNVKGVSSIKSFFGKK